MRNSVPQVISLVALSLLLGACRQDMHNQPKYKPLAESRFFADHRSERAMVDDTVPRGYLRTDLARYTGKVNGVNIDYFPFEITRADVERGRDRFNIYCAPCHSRIGDGNGMVVQRGFKRPPDYTEDKLMKAPVGHFVNVMTNGFGSMSEYKSQLSIQDRWAVAAYIRALQLARKGTAADVPPGTQIANGPPKIETRSEAPESSQQGTHGAAARESAVEPEKK